MVIVLGLSLIGIFEVILDNEKVIFVRAPGLGSAEGGHPDLFRFSSDLFPFALLVSGVAPANQTKERSVHELFAGAFRNKSSMWIVLVFPRKNTRIHKNGRNSWTFRFGPFFGLVCRGDSWLFRKILVSVKSFVRLRGPAAILFTSRDTCSDSIAKLFRACFYGVSHNYRAIRCKMGYRTDGSV